MRRVMALAISIGLGLAFAQIAEASEQAYAFVLPPAPIGPNATAGPDGSVLTLHGAGHIDGHGTSRGRGTYELTDKSGDVIAAGTWTVFGRGSVDDQGPLPEEVWEHVLRKGIVRTRILLDGLGEGKLTLYCAVGRSHLEGFRLTVGGVSYRKIVSGGNGIYPLPA